MAAAALLFGAAAIADDRGVLRDAGGSPYVFVVYDSSGSMAWTPPCTEKDAALDIDAWDGQCTRECTMDPTICEQFDPGSPGSAGAWDPADPDAVKCVEFNINYDEDNPPPAVEIVLDEEEAPSGLNGAITITGSWTSSTAFPPYIGSRYLHNNMAGQGTKSIEFTPILPHDGYYHVYVFYSGDPDSASNVPITVTHADGKAQLFLDQRRTVQREPDHSDEFYNYVGTWQFDAGTGGSVLIETDNTVGRVNVDTVRFTSIERPAGLACLRTGYRYRQPLCPRGDCAAPADGDDPTSKSFQAREALFEVLNERTSSGASAPTSRTTSGCAPSTGSIGCRNTTAAAPASRSSPASPPTSPSSRSPAPIWCWATGRNWDRRPTPTPPATACPMTARLRLRGRRHTYNGDTEFDGTADAEGHAAQVGCWLHEPADTDDLWEMQRASRIPLLGIDHNVNTPVWYRDPNDLSDLNYPDGQVYTVTYSPSSGSYGDSTIDVKIRMQQCDTDNGAAYPTCLTFHSDREVTFELELVTDFVAWEDDTARFPMRTHGFIYEGQNSKVEDFNDCFGLEPNNDTNTAIVLSGLHDDWYQNYSPKWTTTADPMGRGDNGEFDVGDFIPLDWTDDHREDLLGRMAPNLVDPSTGLYDDTLGEPDFRTATYFRNDYLVPFDFKPTDFIRKLRLVPNTFPRASSCRGAAPPDRGLARRLRGLVFRQRHPRRADRLARRRPRLGRRRRRRRRRRRVRLPREVRAVPDRRQRDLCHESHRSG